jgi:hypothetical protein
LVVVSPFYFQKPSSNPIDIIQQEVDATCDEEKVQRALEEHLDVADLGPRLEVIKDEMGRLAEAKAEYRRKQRERQGACVGFIHFVFIEAAVL